MELSTAEDYKILWEKKFIQSLKDEKGNNDKSFEEILIEFAKLHVKAALQAAYDKAEIESGSSLMHDCSIDKDSILNAYPLDLIK